jgi:hypothetical protein
LIAKAKRLERAAQDVVVLVATELVGRDVAEHVVLISDVTDGHP